jgi:cytochrome bd-type quinol oxidase subunit 2
MQKLLSTIVFFLTSFPLLAATTDIDKASAPAETVSMLYVVIFCVVFVGMIAGFFIYLFMSDKDKKPEQK